jgi:hypothetical protein
MPTREESVKADVRRKLSMAVRALEFSQAHPSTDPSYVRVVARLQDCITRLNADAALEIHGHTREHAARVRRVLVRRTRLLEQLRHLVRVARLGVREHPELIELTVLPVPTGANEVFIYVAKGMLERAVSLKDVLAPIGLGEMLLDELATAIGQFELDTQTVHGGRDDHVGASNELRTLTRECVALVGVIGGLNQLRFRDAPELLAGWKSASNVAGPFRRRRGAALPADGGEPPPSGEAGGGK